MVRKLKEKGKKFLSVLASVAIVFATLPGGGLLLAPQTALASTPSGVKATNMNDVSFTVSWVSPVAEQGSVNWGTSPSSLTNTAADTRGVVSSSTHYVNLTSLTPNTTYYYEIVSGGITYNNGGIPYQVTTKGTLGPPSSDPKFAQVFKSDGTTEATGTIVYLTITSTTLGTSAELSDIIETADGGYWLIDIGPIRTSSGSAYFGYQNGDTVSVAAQGGSDGIGNTSFAIPNNSLNITLTPPDSTGPVTSSVSATPNLTNGTVPVTLTASVSDAATGNSIIAAAEYFVDATGANGTGTTMSPSDGTFNSSIEEVTASVGVSGLSAGTHILYVHGKDAKDNWGGTASTTMTIDKTAPTVSSVFPHEGATGVAIGTNVTATFSEAMDASTINSSTFTLVQDVTPVPGIVSYNASTRTATFDATSDLVNSTTYTATVTSGAKDSAGNPLTSNRTWSFTTRAVSSSCDIGIARMRVPKKVKVSGGRETRSKVAITVDNYGTIVQPNVLVHLCLTYPDGAIDSWSQNVAVNLGMDTTRAVFDIALGASHGLGMATWRSQVVAPMDENSSNDSAVPMYTELW